ncbi:MAG: BrnA antitoxin family protein [Patescibacteria group bacterium]
MKKQLKQIPVFKNEDAERDFWAKADSSEYFDFSKARKVIFPNLKPSAKSISLRLPESMLNELKITANKRDVPYQSLIKNFIADKLRELRNN